MAECADCGAWWGRDALCWRLHHQRVPSQPRRGAHPRRRPGRRHAAQRALLVCACRDPWCAPSVSASCSPGCWRNCWALHTVNAVHRDHIPLHRVCCCRQAPCACLWTAAWRTCQLASCGGQHGLATPAPSEQQQMWQGAVGCCGAWPAAQQRMWPSLSRRETAVLAARII